MAEGRALTYPQAIAFGARCLTAPGRGNVLCASATVPFGLTDGKPVEPARWYEALRECVGDAAVPDAMTPLPRAEVLLLGAVTVPGPRHEVTVRCGSVGRTAMLTPDPEAPERPVAGGPDDAVWHEEDNPGGRGGPDDDRRPLIVDADKPRRPLWFGHTPLQHPVRRRRMGVPDEQSHAGWPKDADLSVFHETHEAFWADRLQPGDPLVVTGLCEQDIDIDLPRYRVAMASARAPDGEWFAEDARIHCVTLLPGAGIGAMIWRATMELGEDIMGESITALVAALEDADAPPRDHYELAYVAVARWLQPERALDDRPLLPPAMAAAVELPFGMPPEGSPHARRQSAAEDWMTEEMGIGANPFAAPSGEKDFVGQMQDALGDGDGPPDPNALGDVADAALAQSKELHEKEGFGDVQQPSPRNPVRRGERLDAEIENRVSKPHQTAQEVAIANGLRSHDAHGLDADDILARLADARIQSPEAPLFWPALFALEAVVLGARFLDRLEEGRLPRHLDVCGAIFEGESGRPRRLHGRRVEGLLAEETAWRWMVFEDCTFLESTFAFGRFENCEFRRCVLEGVNVTNVHFEDCRFLECELRDVHSSEPSFRNGLFEDCALERVSLAGMAMRDVTFRGGSWLSVQMDQGILVDNTIHGTTLEEVTFTLTHAPYTRFEGVSMLKVSAMSKGFPGSVFKEVEAKNCLFGDSCHFDEASFETVRFVETGFTNAVFTETRFAPDCSFVKCDFTGAMFAETVLTGCRFRNCTMSMSVWGGSDASDAWFFGSILRGVHFGDTHLARAVFADADLSGATFRPEEIVGADFTGTVRDR